MDKKAAIVTSVIIIVISSALAYVLLNRAADPKKEAVPDAPAATTEQIPVSPSSVSAPGIYTAYSAEAVASAKGDILLFFHAPWCPQCREIEQSIATATLPDNLTILKIDYDSSQALRQQYGVTLQTTFVKVDSSGNKIESYVAYDEPTFDAVKRELL